MQALQEEIEEATKAKQKITISGAEGGAPEDGAADANDTRRS